MLPCAPAAQLTEGDGLAAACNWPPVKDGDGDVVRVRITLTDPTGLKCRTKGPSFSDTNRATYVDSTPANVEARLCYSEVAFTNRPWRKKNKPYPSVSGGVVGARVCSLSCSHQATPALALRHPAVLPAALPLCVL